MRRRAALLTIAMLLGAAPLGTGRALESAPVVSERASVRLIADHAAAAPGQTIRIGLHQRLAPGWHTYWKNPGDAGAPTEITLTAPQTPAEIAWPAPERIPEGPLVVFGYKTEVLLPLSVQVPVGLAPGGTFAIEAEANWLVCERLCVPEDGVFRLEIPLRAQPVLSETAPLFARTEALLPRPSPFEVTAGFEGARGGLRLTGSAIAPASVRDAVFFPDQWGVLDHAAPQAARIEQGVLTLALTRGQVPLGERLSGVVVLSDPRGGRAAFAIAAPVEAALPSGMQTAPAPWLALWKALLFAAIGGLILNLMPCVFPILAMKAFGLARLGGAERRTVRAHAASYTLGVVLSFAAIGAALVLLRAGGSMVGWGVQFTQPAFLAAMAWLMLSVGLNLSGVFHVGGPVGAGSGLAARGGHAGSFATGMLAVLVATPCTAPFMAAALGAALAMPPASALAVFIALGLGMAAPYALLGLFPRIALLLPRPGAWMDRLKQFLAFPMYGAAAWLVWVLAEAGGPDSVLVALAGAVALALAAWMVGLAQAGAPRLLRPAALLPLTAALALLPGLAGPTDRPPASTTATIGAEAWSAERVASLQAEGRPVFVNFTAAWCISCKVNEQLALNRDAVQRAFRRENVAYLKADWTRGDAAIGAALRAHGREGVPLYLLYPPGGGPARVLPEFLTEGIVLDALAATRVASAGVSSASISQGDR